LRFGLLICLRCDSIRLAESMNKRTVKSYQDITVTEVTQSDGEGIIKRAYSVRVATDPSALRQFSDLGSARDYFDELVLRRLNSITLAALRH
jgi:hypothetical protein